MTLKVNQILHHEESKYQDVLNFESSDHGTVLVLDNVIQCTEQDEFAYAITFITLPMAPTKNWCPPANLRTLRSYQEMITHLAMKRSPESNNTNWLIGCRYRSPKYSTFLKNQKISRKCMAPNLAKAVLPIIVCWLGG